MRKKYQSPLTNEVRGVADILADIQGKAKVSPVSVVAFLVLGSDGSSSLNGMSAGLSTPADRTYFLEARRKFNCILIGGRTANSESYARTPTPLVIVSRARPSLLDQNPRAHWWNCSPVDALKRAKEDFGLAIAIEGGINFLSTLLQSGVIDELRLSITPKSGGENMMNPNDLIGKFQKVVKSKIDDTIFYVCSSPKIKSQK